MVVTANISRNSQPLAPCVPSAMPVRCWGQGSGTLVGEAPWGDEVPGTSRQWDKSAERVVQEDFLEVEVTEQMSRFGDCPKTGSQEGAELKGCTVHPLALTHWLEHPSGPACLAVWCGKPAHWQANSRLYLEARSA